MDTPLVVLHLIKFVGGVPIIYAAVSKNARYLISPHLVHFENIQTALCVHSCQLCSHFALLLLTRGVFNFLKPRSNILMQINVLVSLRTASTNFSSSNSFLVKPHFFLYFFIVFSFYLRTSI